MKVLTKLLADFVAWRWAPTVGLLSASVLFVLIVVGLVPSEIGTGVASPKFAAPRTASTSAAVSQGFTATTLAPGDDGASEEPPPAAVAAAPVRPADFGRRGFSPVLDRPEPPPAAPPPAPPPAQVVAEAPPAEQAAPAPTTPPGRVAGLFQSVQNALRGGPFNNLVQQDPANAPGAAPGAPGAAPNAPGEAPAAPGDATAPGTPPAAEAAGESEAPAAPGDQTQPAAPDAPGSAAPDAPSAPAPGGEAAPNAAPGAAPGPVAPVH